MNQQLEELVQFIRQIVPQSIIWKAPLTWDPGAGSRFPPVM
jgi:hypothetical protein